MLIKPNKTPEMSILWRQSIEKSSVKFFQALREYQFNQKLVQTDQGYQSHQSRPIWTRLGDKRYHWKMLGHDCSRAPPKKKNAHLLKSISYIKMKRIFMILCSSKLNFLCFDEKHEFVVFWIFGDKVCLWNSGYVNISRMVLILEWIAWRLASL